MSVERFRVWAGCEAMSVIEDEASFPVRQGRARERLLGWLGAKSCRRDLGTSSFGERCRCNELAVGRGFRGVILCFAVDTDMVSRSGP